MAKTSLWRYPCLSLVQQKALLSLAYQLSELWADQLKPPLNRFRRSRIWLWVLAGAIALLMGWQLLLAIGVGVVSMRLYRMQEQPVLLLWFSLHQFLRGPYRQAVLTAAIGGIATVSTYLATSVWIEAKNPWMAVGTILQGLGIFLVLVLLVWQTLNRRADLADTKFDQLVINLTQSDPLKRLIAVRQLSQWGQGPQVDSTRKAVVAEYFQLMLRQESETVIQNAILEGLQVVESSQKLNSAVSPLLLPNLKQARGTQPTSSKMS